MSNSLYGTAPEIIRHYIEIRGVGVIDVQQLFGMGAVQFDTEIDLVIQLEQWEDGKFYDRLGLGEEKYTMLDVSLPIVTIPVRPGRNLAGIVEIATMKNRQMKYGYNAARDFVTQFDSKVDAMLKKKEHNGRGGEQMKYVGVDIGGTNLKAGLVDESGTLLATQKMKRRVHRRP